MTTTLDPELGGDTVRMVHLDSMDRDSAVTLAVQLTGLSRDFWASTLSSVPDREWSLKELQILGLLYKSTLGVSDSASDVPPLPADGNILGSIINSLPNELNNGFVRCCVFPSSFLPSSAAQVVALETAQLDHLTRMGLLDYRRGRYNVHGILQRHVQGTDAWKAVEQDALTMFADWISSEIFTCDQLQENNRPAIAYARFDSEVCPTSGSL